MNLQTNSNIELEWVDELSLTTIQVQQVSTLL